MPSFEHKKIIEELAALDALPDDKDAIATWIRAEAHLKFLENNANSREIVIYACPDYSFIYSVAVPETMLESLDKEDLMNWHCDPWTSAASYASGGGRKGIWVERDEKTEHGMITQLIYGRTFEGWSGDDHTYFELSQEYAHLEDLHWRPEERAYCRYNKNGNLLHVVSVTQSTSDAGVTLVSFNRESLDSYLAASNQVLIRRFDFTLLNRDSFSGWGSETTQIFDASDEIFYRQSIQGLAAYTVGIQIIRPRLPKSQIFARMEERWSGAKEKGHVEFITQDWRNNRVTRISTDPEATTSYFDAKGNDLPFEVSPAFFDPEVLLKYKSDKDKYTIKERSIECRASWYLRSIDVNEAGQIFAYIRYLRNLPESELLHWQSYNEEPKAPISERALVNDFQGKFGNFVSPLGKIRGIVQTWNEKAYAWWKRRDARLIDKVTPPHTASRDEWGDSFLALTQLVNEGFVVKEIRQHLSDNGVPFESQDGSLALLEKLINARSSPEEPIRLNGLRTAQLIRTKAKGHNAESDARQLSMDAVSKHGSYYAHFQHICEQICDELEMIQGLFNGSAETA